MIGNGDAASLNKPASKMRPLELDKVKRQLKKLLAVGFICFSILP
jgi:hypothetical protein